MLAAPATAATYPADYTCSTPVGPQTFTANVTFDAPTTVVSGTVVPSRPVTVAVTIPAGLVGTLKTLFGVTSVSGSVSGASYRVGAQQVPVTGLTVPLTPLPPSGDLILTANGTAGAFTAPAPGTYDVKLPSGFSVTAKDQDNDDLPGVPYVCALAATETDDGLIGEVTVTANPNPPAKVASTTTPKVLNAPITTAKRPKVRVTVAAVGKVPTGKVTAKLGTRVLKTGTLIGGKVVLRLPKLTKGRKAVVFRYAGDSAVNPSSKRLVIRVK